MKPLKLRMKYFGPYIDETMNFTEFDNTPLFLISGKTGSGKTTIFDAMSFALFDHTSGDERDAKQMRSDFATPNDATEVTFVFEHNGIKYTVIRSPKMNLAKKRGNGTRDVEASVKVKYINKEQENIEITKKNQADKFLRDLIGLDAQQFTQIVLLPQGKFRNFLNANSADREKILRKLFGTSLYQKWTEKIQEQAKINESENEKLTTQIQIIRQQVEIEDNDEINDEEWIVKVNNQIEEKKKKQEKVNNDITISQKQLDNLVETYQNEKVLADSIKQKEDNIHKLQSLENNQDKIELKKIYAYKLAWYQKNQQIFNNKTDLELQIKEKSDKLVLLNQESKFLIQKHESAKIEAQELEKQQENIENLKNKISTLEVKLPIYQDVKVNQEKLDNLDKNYQDTKNRLDNSVKELEKQKETLGERYPNKLYIRMKTLMEETLNNQADWVLFESYFNSTHQNFMDRLRQRYSDLTTGDLRICCLLRMNLSTKEIASLMNVSVRAIELRRYRLRKRLELEGDTNLVDFLMNF